MDLLGFTALHHAARAGQWNCVSFLVNFGANIWKMDNDLNTAMAVAAVENRTEIVKILDMAQSDQELKNPKVVRQLKEKAMKDAEKNALMYEKLQEKASKDLERQKRQQEKLEAQMNGDFKAPTSKSLVTRLTWKMKGNTAKLKTAKGASVFSDLAGTTRGKVQRDGSAQFTVSEMDESGNRTTKAVRGTMSRSGGQVLYTKSFDIDIGDGDASLDPSQRPALTNVFPGALNNTNDSGIDSSGDADEAPGLFNRPMLGKLAFLKPFTPDLDINGTQNGDANDDGWAIENGMFSQNGTDEKDSTGDETGESPGGLPANQDDDDEDPLDDDDDETEFTPVMVFLEACGLLHFAHIFLKGEVDMEALMMLKNSDFADMEIPIGPRRKLMDAIQRRRVVMSEPAQMYDSQL